MKQFSCNFDEFDKDIKEVKIFVTGFDSSMKNVKAAQKQAKIAGIHKLVKISRVDVSWMEMKHEKDSVDCICTQLPMYTKHAKEDDINKLQDEFFYQCEYVLKKTGKIALICRTEEGIEVLAEKFKFKLIEKRKFYQGQEVLFCWVFSK